MLPDKSDAGFEKDDLQRLLKEALRTKRPRRYRLIGGAFLVISGCLALGAWLFYPPAQPKQLLVVAFDDVAPAGKEVTLRGRLDAPLDERAKLGGRDMVFVDGESLPVPGQQAKIVSAKSGPHGEVSSLWSFPPDKEQGQFILRHIGETYSAGMEDRGQIFFIPAGTPLCLVQYDETVIGSAADAIPMQETTPALEEIRKKGFAIVYLALRTNRPADYQKMRDKLRRWNDAFGAFPEGALLSQFNLPGTDADKRPWQKVGEMLVNRFPLAKTEKAFEHIAIAGTIDVAQQFHAAKLRTLYLGSGEDLPAGVRRLKSWEDVPPALEK
jgi:hypothetical protein